MRNGSAVERVVLLHGVGESRGSMRMMELVLVGAGFEVLNLTYPSRRKRLEVLVEDVHEGVRRFLAKGEGMVHFVGHSMGGLVIRAYIRRYRPDRLGRVVMLGTPNQGSELADLLDWNPVYRVLFGPAGRQLGTKVNAGLREILGDVDFCAGVVAGNRANRWLGWVVLPKPNDGRVAVESTKVLGMTDHVTLAVTHDGMMRHAQVQLQVLAFLKEGRFSRGR